jgi:hypothetical protein
LPDPSDIAGRSFSPVRGQQGPNIKLPQPQEERKSQQRRRRRRQQQRRRQLNERQSKRSVFLFLQQQRGQAKARLVRQVPLHRRLESARLLHHRPDEDRYRGRKPNRHSVTLHRRTPDNGSAGFPPDPIPGDVSGFEGSAGEKAESACLLLHQGAALFAVADPENRQASFLKTKKKDAKERQIHNRLFKNIIM